MPISGHPRTDPDRPDSCIRLLPRVFDGEALFGPGMKDARRGKPAVGQFRHPIPREAVLLAAPPKRSTPEVDQVMPKRCERPTIRGNRIISEVACNDLPQPVALSWDSLVHSPPQLHLDFLELRPHAVAPGLPLKLEGSSARFTADEGEAQKCEGLRSTDTTFLAIDAWQPNSIKRVLSGWSDSENASNRSRIPSRKRRASLMLEAGHQVIGVAHDDHVASGHLPSPAFSPQIEYVVQIDVAEER